MRNTILIILFTLFSFVGYSQIQKWEEVDKSTLVTQTYQEAQETNGWVLLSNLETGGDFWYIVYRTYNANSLGWYGYYVNFFSNSWLYNEYDGQTKQASTYIDGYVIYMYEYYWSYFPNYGRYDWELRKTQKGKGDYKIVDWNNKHVWRFWSKSPYCLFSVGYSDSFPYDFSKYSK